jgi:hypothetical protein
MRAMLGACVDPETITAAHPPWSTVGRRVLAASPRSAVCTSLHARHGFSDLSDAVLEGVDAPRTRDVVRTP